jgi:hypothetical protein
MKMACPECKKEFVRNEALTGGWLTPRKVFGCPHCKTFFTKDPYAALVGGGGSLVTAGLGVVNIYEGLGDDSMRDLLFGSVILLLSVMGVLYARAQFRKNVASLERLQVPLDKK